LFLIVTSLILIESIYGIQKIFLFVQKIFLFVQKIFLFILYMHKMGLNLIIG